MHKTIYVDIDEEITSVIDRIRREGAPDVFLVVPKNAMLCQGILNLKLLKKESDRLGKNIMMVTSDKQAKKVIERAGLTISNKPINDAEQHAKPKRPSLPDRAAKEALSELGTIDESLRDKILAEGNEIGSTSFYDSSAAEDFNAIVATQPNVQANNAESGELTQKTPPVERGGNSFLDAGSHATRKQPAPNHSAIDLRIANANVPSAGYPRIPAESPKSPLPHSSHKVEVAPVRFSTAAQSQSHNNVKKSLALPKTHSKHPTHKEPAVSGNHMSFASNWQTQEAEEFFADYNQKLKEESSLPKQKKSSRRLNLFAYYKWILGAVVVLSLLGAAGYFFTYSSVAITIYPSEKKIDLPVEIKAVPSLQQANPESQEVPANDQDVQITKTLDFSATGEKSVSETGKSRGNVTITNNYSSSPQVLVATTRILSKEGKLFRLSSQVTVPGMNASGGGKVEAEVVADETGQSYDIGPSTFTIEGFKGTPKYDKFEVVSSTNMKGGENTAGSKVKVVSAKDIELARQQTIDELENNIEQEIKSQIKSSASDPFTYIIKKDISKAGASNKEGDQTDTFSYTIVEDVSVRIVAQTDIDQALRAKAQQTRESGYELKEVSEISHDKSNISKDNAELDISFVAKASYVPSIDIENIRRGILGKSEDEVQKLLGNYQEIEKIEIKFSPVWKSKIPVSADKVRIEIVSQSNNK